MILAFHLILSAYGFWLPNDPRGSWSDFVRAWELLRYGEATKVATRKSVAYVPHDVDRRLHAKDALQYDPVLFDGVQARAIARGFNDAATEAGYKIHACAILPDHTHLIVGRHTRNVRRIMSHLKAKATMRMSQEGVHPFGAYRHKRDEIPPPWAGKGWSVFIDSVDHVRAAIAYVERNPTKEGLKKQRWGFVTPYAW